MELYLDKAQQFATFEQSRELIALGVRHTNPFYYVHNNGGIVTYSNWKVDFDTCTVAFTLADIMALLPQTVMYNNSFLYLSVKNNGKNYELSYMLDGIIKGLSVYKQTTSPTMCLTHVAAQLLINILQDKQVKII